MYVLRAGGVAVAATTSAAAVSCGMISTHLSPGVCDDVPAR